MTEIKTSPELRAALGRAVRAELSRDELHQQRVSFAMSCFDEGEAPTRQRVEEIVSKQDGVAAE